MADENSQAEATQPATAPEWQDAGFVYPFPDGTDMAAQEAAVKEAANGMDPSQVPQGTAVFAVPEGGPPPAGSGWEKTQTITPDGYDQSFDVYANPGVGSGGEGPTSPGPEALQDVEQDFTTAPPGEPCLECEESVGESGFWEGMIPIWGSGRDAVNAFQNGEIGWGLFHTAMAVSDVFLVGAVVKMAGKAVLKTTIKKGGKELGEKVFKEGAEEVAEKSIKEGTESAAEQAAKKGGGRGKNKLKPDEKAQSDHTVFRRGDDGKIYKYETYEKTPSGHWNPKKRYDGGKPDGSPGAPHRNKTTGEKIPTPHVQGKDIPGGVRPAKPSDIPGGPKKSP